MATLTQPFNINGVVSTDRSVLQNLNDLATACGCFLTYDIDQGQWSVIINNLADSVASFDDASIIGGINVSGTGIAGLFNSATIEFPHRDLRDRTDYIDLEIPQQDRFPNELDNRLNMSNNLINDPIQAQYLATVELKQGRLDKIIEFRTDYTRIGLKAGDVITVSNTALGFVNKPFRIVKLIQSDDEVLSIGITAIEYDADVYSSAGLIRTERTKKTGIVPKAVNTAVTASENRNIATGNADGSNELLAPAAIAAILALGIGPLFEFLKTQNNTASAGATANNPGTTIPSYATAFAEIPEATVMSQFNLFAGQVEDQGFVGDSTAGVNATFTLPVDFDTVLFIVNNSFSDFLLLQSQLAAIVIGNFPAVDTVTKTQFPELSAPVVTDISFTLQTVVEDIFSIVAPESVDGYIPVETSVLYNGQQFLAQFSGIDSATSILNVAGAPAGEYTLVFQPSPIYAVGSSADNLLTHHGYYNATGLGSIQVTVLAFKN